MPAERGIFAVLILASLAYSLPLDQVSNSASGKATSEIREGVHQIARPDEGLVMHCNVTGKS